MPVLYYGILSTGRMLWDSSRVMAIGGVEDAVVLGMVDSGLTAEVIMEKGSDLGLLDRCCVWILLFYFVFTVRSPKSCF